MFQKFWSFFGWKVVTSFFVPSECGGFVARKIAEDEDMMRTLQRIYIILCTINSCILYIGGDFLLHFLIVKPYPRGQEIQLIIQHLQIETTTCSNRGRLFMSIENPFKKAPKNARRLLKKSLA